MKSEPDVFSILDLKKKKTTLWDGVRNYQARNFMKDQMQVGDLVLFYHSNAKPSGIAGIARVAKPASPDPTQFDPSSEYFDPKATREQPRWFCVTVEFVEMFDALIPLETLRNEARLKTLELLKRGSRLSVHPVSPEHFAHILKMANSKLDR